jgi:hypothetical protein
MKAGFVYTKCRMYTVRSITNGELKRKSLDEFLIRRIFRTSGEGDIGRIRETMVKHGQTMCTFVGIARQDSHRRCVYSSPRLLKRNKILRRNCNLSFKRMPELPLGQYAPAFDPLRSSLRSSRSPE